MKLRGCRSYGYRAVWLFAFTVLALSVFTLCAAFSAFAQPVGADSVRVSVLTCMPGREIYALDGHSAIRVQTARGDSVWNYGLFSFEEPNFVYRFVKGETDYMVGAYPTAWFLPEYQERGSRVYEQEVILSKSEKERLIRLLHDDLKPENRVYRYNYIKDNCATRIRDHIEESVGGVRYTDTLHYGTFRRQMRSHHDGYPWYQFGIDLALGSGLDKEINSRDEMFTPLEMMVRLDNARRADGSPVVKPRAVLVEGSDHAVDDPTPWWLSPLAIFTLIFFGIVFAAWKGYRRGRPVKWVYALYYGVVGLGGCLIAFLVFISTHEATSPNLLIWWLNPFQLLVPAFIWSRRTRSVVTVMMYYNLVVVGILLILWPTGNQSLNIADLPLMLSDIALSAAWVLTNRQIVGTSLRDVESRKKRQNVRTSLRDVESRKKRK